MLVVMAVSVFNEAEQSGEHVAQEQDLRGVELLRDEAAKLDAKRRAAKKGHGLDLVDSMMHRFQTEKEDDEEKKEMKQLDKGLALSPKDLGIVTYNPDGTPQLNLLQQQDDESWTPQGQQGLADDMKKAHQEEDAAQTKEDGLKGHDVLSSIGLSDGQQSEDSDDFELVQDDGGDWAPSGQSGLAEQIGKAHQKEEAAQIKADGLDGDDMLGSAGIGGSHASSKGDELELMQEWRPQGQKLNDTPEEVADKASKQNAEEVFEAQEAAAEDKPKKEIEQTDILGAVHLRHHLKEEQEDEVEAMGVINTDDIQLIQKSPTPSPTPSLLKAVKSKKKVVSKKVAKKAVKVTKKIAGKSASKKAAVPKQMVKNAMFLKVYAEMIADKVVENSRHLGALGTLLKGMAVKSKRSAVAQYNHVMKTMAKTATRGLPKYTLRHVAKAMMGKGLIVMAPVQYKAGIYVRLDGRDLGLQHSYPLLGHLAVSVNSFVGAMAALKKKTTIDLKSKQHFTLRDFNRLFRPTCAGTASAYNKCLTKTKKTCTSPCKWLPAWDGSAFAATISAIAMDV